MKNPLATSALALTLAAAASACAKPGANQPPPAAPASSAATPAAPAAPAATEQTIQGELVDLACYLDHGAKGVAHKACGTTCALRGLPIGLLDKDNRITIVIGLHDRPMNTELADKIGSTLKLTGKVVSRDGVQMIEVSAVQ